MDLQDAKWRKPVVFGGVVLLLLGSAGAYYAGVAEEPPLVLQKTEKMADSSLEAPMIKGLARANDVQELRNPFSLLHEREGEIAGNELKKASSEQIAASPVLPVSPEKQAAPAKHGEKEGILLCGIVEGAGGRLAILQVGSNTVNAGCGETVAGWQVMEISRESVTVAGNGQVRRLPLTMAPTEVKR